VSTPAAWHAEEPPVPVANLHSVSGPAKRYVVAAIYQNDY